MSDEAPAPQPPPIFNLQAYSPAEIKEAVEKVGVKKANLPFLASFMLAIVGGGSIGFGAVYYTIVASDPDLSFATIRVLGVLVFSLSTKKTSSFFGSSLPKRPIPKDGSCC